MKTPRSTIRTAEELLNSLQADPEYQARIKELNRLAELNTRPLREAAQPLVAALRAIGLNVDSIADLVNTAVPYPEALPLLYEHLHKKYPDEVLGDISRALAIPDSAGHWNEIVGLYKAVDKSRRVLKEALSCTLAASMTDATLPELIELASNPENGESRVILLHALRRSKNEKAKAALQMLASDPELTKQIAEFRARDERNERRRLRNKR
jgi:hypothetical protein